MRIFPGDGSQNRNLFFATILTTLAAGCDSSVLAPREPRGKSPSPLESTPGDSPGAKTETERRLQTVVARRLAIMPAVARWKWEHGAPIEDRDREAELISAFVRKAESRGFDAELATTSIVDQIEAAKEIQRHCFERWKIAPPPPDSPVLDLATQLRPRIDRLTDELLDALESECANEPRMK